MGNKKNEKIVSEVQIKTKLPVYNEFGLTDNEPLTTKEKALDIEPKPLSREEMEQVLAEKKYASHYESRGDTSIIRFDPNPHDGLSHEIVAYQVSQKMVNSSPRGSTKTITNIIVSNVFTFFNILMFAVAAWLIVSAIVTGSKIFDTITQLFFLVIVTINIGVSIVQEIRSKKIIDKLSVLNAPTATAIRDKEKIEIAVNEVVLDDILFLQSGKQIPSDCIVVEGAVEVNESLLTGESDSIVKQPGDILHSGSFIVSGSCYAKVERIGDDNYIEKLTSQAKKYRKPMSELKKSLTNFIHIMAIIIIPLGTLVFLRMFEGVNMGGTKDYMYSVSHTAGAVVGMIPSGLFLCTSIALAVGAIRLSQNNCLVQELNCIEMLARVDVLCLDKTGTITDGSMTVKDVLEYKTIPGFNTKNIISAMQNALNDDNVTSKALDAYFGRAKKVKVKECIPFSSQRKYSAVEFDKFGSFFLGAPEFILGKRYQIVSDDVNAAASKGYRVLLLAQSMDSLKKEINEIEPLALIMIEDNIRPDAIETIDYFKRSGVEVKVISGDNPLTVSRISQRAGIVNADKYISLDGKSDKDVIKFADKYTVFGRVSPNQKKLLVMTLKTLGRTVAMTGDGVNDILALREADCSISVASGSEAARNVSHLVLLDSNFSSMPKVVTEGRRVINNIQKVASLFLTKTIFSFLLAIVALIRRDYPIQTNQLFIIETFVIGIPSFFLALEPNNQRFSGNFMINVIRNALPGAISIAISTSLIFALEGVVGLTDPSEVRTIIVLNATFTCFVVLYKVCTPFNVMRRFLFFTMSVLGIIFLIFLPNVMNIHQVLPIELAYLKGYQTMSVVGVLLTLVMVLSAYPAIYVINHSKKWIKDGVNYFVNTVSKNRGGNE